MCFSCPPEGPGLDGEAAAEDKTEGAGTPYISVQPFPALLDLPCGADAVAASCGSRHTAVVTREWGDWGRRRILCSHWHWPFQGDTPQPGGRQKGQRVASPATSSHALLAGTGELFSWGWGKCLCPGVD